MAFDIVYGFQHLAWDRMFPGAFERFGVDRRGHAGWFDVFVCPFCLI
jgi:hypothetical protein